MQLSARHGQSRTFECCFAHLLKEADINATHALAYTEEYY